MKSSVKHFWTNFRKFDGLSVGQPRYNNIASDRRQTKEEYSYTLNKSDHVPPTVPSNSVIEPVVDPAIIAI